MLSSVASVPLAVGRDVCDSHTRAGARVYVRVMDEFIFSFFFLPFTSFCF